jgi:broad specificity phosphatase PhoE
MPTTFVLLRHAQGTHNANTFQKPTHYQDPIYIDAELTEEGWKQTKETGEQLRNTHFDAIFCSPMRRCRSTLLGVLPSSIDRPVQLDDRLLEQYATSLSCHTQELLPATPPACNKRLERHEILPTCPPAWNTDRISDTNPWTEQPNKDADLTRIRDFTEEVQTTHPNQSVLVVSHCEWISRWCEMYPKTEVHLKNCQFVTVTIEK